MAAAAAFLLSCAPAFAQVGGMGITPGSSPLGMTSPLGIGPGLPVAPVGIPLGATELASPGVSPTTSGASPMGPATGSIALCSGIGGSVPQASFGVSTAMTPGNPMTGMPFNSVSGSSVGTGMSTGVSSPSTIFDGGGTTGNASGTCVAGGGSALAGPAASASSPTGMSAMSVGRVGIPLGSTELGAGGLSPPPEDLTVNPSVPTSTFGGTRCTSTGMSSSNGMSALSGSC